MALYTTFGELLRTTRANARLSPTSAVSAEVDARHKVIVNEVYETIFDDYDWPHLRYTTPLLPLSAGQQFYDLPDAIDYNRIEQFVVWWSGEPYPLDPGIGPKEYAAYDSSADERSDPPQRYDIRSQSEGSTQFEIWPLPTVNTVSVQITGTRKWSRLVNTVDICLVDDTAVALMAASHIVAPIDTDFADRLANASGARLSQVRSRSVQPQTGGSTAPNVGGGQPHVSLRDGKAIVRVGRGA
ncbi:MAG: hypothetical protein AAGF53_02325 [Pseudomonadota bacterium]